MSTLFERILGGGEGVSKIPIHGIRAFAGEINRGRRSVADVVSAYDLTPAQQTDWETFLGKMASATDKVALSNMVFDWLALAEQGVMPEVYRDEAAFWAAVDAEIAAQAV